MMTNIISEQEAEEEFKKIVELVAGFPHQMHFG